MPANKYQLDGLNILVTGSSQGIGQAIALRLARDGANVVINYHSHPETGEATAEEIKKMGRKSVALQADLGKVDEVRTLVEKSIEALGSLDVLVNNAGVEKRAEFSEVTEADYDLVMETNLKGTFFTTQSFVRHLTGRKAKGKIINISSVHEDLPFPHFTAYCASKGGIKMFMRNLGVELGPLGITINDIAPGAIETPINSKLLNDPKLLDSLLGNIPLGRLGQTADVAGVAAFLASSDSDYITGTTITVDGGLTWNYSEQ